MDFNGLKASLKSTPAFVFDEKVLADNLKEIANLKKKSGCLALYSIKALPLERVLKMAKEHLDGLSASSLFEAKLAKEILADTGAIHITTPGLKENEFKEIAALCSHITFNSNNQCQRLQRKAINEASLGLRVNPKLSYSNDLRFDPCRPYSKLGVALDRLPRLTENIEGLHFHTVFSNTDYQALENTVRLLEQKLGDQLTQFKWINLGGGYLYHQIGNHQPFINLVTKLKAQYALEVYIEPGKAIVGNAGYLVSSVIDCFISDGKNIAVMDTSVNHNPEVFEYQKSPELFEADSQGEYSCLLVGSSCLAGDIFGEYQFSSPLKVGDRLVFLNVGAYSLIKANRFNGYNLPDIYWLGINNDLVLIKQDNYQNYRSQW